jgi:hypothetical protein
MPAPKTKPSNAENIGALHRRRSPPFVDHRMGNCLAQNSARWSIWLHRSIFPYDVRACFAEGILFHNEFVTAA